MITALLVIGGVLAVLLLLLAARGTSPEVRNPEELQTIMQSLDLEAFRNLVSPEQEEFLRVTLPAREFGRVRRARVAAAITYVKAAARNASALLRLAEAGKQSSDPQVAASAEELAQSAIQMRVYALFAIANLYMVMISPRLSVGVSTVERYRLLKYNLVHFVSLSQPGLTSTISESL